MVNRRGLTVFVFWLSVVIIFVALFVHPSHSSEISDHCKEVREAVDSLKSQGKSLADIEVIARNYGATDQMIADAKACLVHKHGVK